MKSIAKFDKVSLERIQKDTPYLLEQTTMNEIKLPKRSTKGSAGYDFFAPFDFALKPGGSILIPTGIRCYIEEGWVLSIYPRSGQGFKTGVTLANTVGIIDSDYYFSENEGHIMVRLTNNNSAINKTLNVKKGQAFCQGIFTQYGLVIGDKVTEERNGGFGSTDKKEIK